MVRTFSGGGSLSAILPKGCKKLEDCTAEFIIAMDHAASINSWFRNCSEEEMPPRWMWPFDAEIEEWFNEVKLARENRANGGSGDGDADSEDMVVNEYAKDLRG